MNFNYSARLLTVAVVSMLAASACTSTRTQKSAGENIDDAVVISTAVNTALVSDSLTKAHTIDVEVFKGRVQLNGFVGSNTERKQAAVLTRKVSGVVAVDNNLELQGESRSTGETVDDAAITNKVKSALVTDGRTKAHEINVETRHSVVLLAGFVSTDVSRSAAGEIARAISGVKKVDNQIAIK
jgi:hyperosmotically inducible periplasmic protein